MQRRNKYQEIYNIVARIPSGKVATYGQIAVLAGYPGQARQVGYALNRTPEELDIPWQRVINAKGRISPRSDPVFETIQQQMLESEGVVFNESGMIDLNIFQWKP